MRYLQLNTWILQNPKWHVETAQDCGSQHPSHWPHSGAELSSASSPSWFCGSQIPAPPCVGWDGSGGLEVQTSFILATGASQWPSAGPSVHMVYSVFTWPTLSMGPSPWPCAFFFPHDLLALSSLSMEGSCQAPLAWAWQHSTTFYWSEWVTSQVQREGRPVPTSDGRSGKIPLPGDEGLGGRGIVMSSQDTHHRRWQVTWWDANNWEHSVRSLQKQVLSKRSATLT